MIFRQQGIGHGNVTLADALAESCNVYFFDHANRLGPEPLLAWARRFGFGRPTGVELPDEAGGSLPAASPQDPRAERLAVAQALAIGQGTLTATPLQIARLMAAVANGGTLSAPRITLDPEGTDSSGAASAGTAPVNTAEPGPRLRIAEATLSAVRAGLEQAVADPRGTAHVAARAGSVPLAGKTGTAQNSGADHAWFAGYAPAAEPRFALVVVLEHGRQAERAARLTREVVARMERLGYFRPAIPRALAGE